MTAPEYVVFDAACKLAASRFREGRSAEARHVLDTAAAQVCRDVADATCDLIEVGA